MTVLGCAFEHRSNGANQRSESGDNVRVLTLTFWYDFLFRHTGKRLDFPSETHG